MRILNGRAGVVDVEHAARTRAKVAPSSNSKSTSTDGGGYSSRETAKPAKLIVEFEPGE